MADLPPPLDDLSEVILENRAKRQKGTFLDSSSSQIGGSNKNESKTSSNQKPSISSAPVTSVSKNCAQCGIAPGTKTHMRCTRCKIVFYCSKEHQRAHWKTHKSTCKKPSVTKSSPSVQAGFFDNIPRKNPSSTSSSSHTNSGVDDMPFIQPQAAKSAADRLVLPEVQQAILDSASTNPKGGANSWMNKDFLNKLANNPELSKALQDPKMTVAIAEFAENPQAAMAKYQNDQKVQEFFVQYIGLVGGHMGLDKKDKKQTASKSNDSKNTGNRANKTKGKGSTAPMRKNPNNLPPPPVDHGDMVQFGDRMVPKVCLLFSVFRIYILCHMSFISNKQNMTIEMYLCKNRLS